MQPGIEQSSAVALFDQLARFRDEITHNNKHIYFDFANFCRENALRSKSQLLQDLLVLYLTGSKKGGFFVEFGATNGVTLSNSFLLEKDYRWKGILAEPATCWHGALRANRRATIDLRCVWSTTGERLLFSETPDVPELSTIEDFRLRDFNRDARTNNRHYEVETISLNDLLKLHNAPQVIDYMSVDTEGSEFSILSQFDFSSYKVKIFTIEHNYSPQDRENIFSLMSAHGYTRILEPMSRWDDWYVEDAFLTRFLEKLAA
jgi:FkbM family methyltransferase